MTTLDPSTSRRLAASRWYAVQTYASAERQACAALLAAGFGVYLPMRRFERQHARTKAWLMRDFPLIPQYLFVELPVIGAAEWYAQGLRPSWARLRSCKGVMYPLGALTPQGEVRPCPIDPRVVEALMAAQANLEFDDTRQSRARHEARVAEVYRAGVPVRIKSGPFGDVEGEVLELTRNGDVRVLISMLQQLVPISLEPANLEVLDKVREAA